MAVLTSDQLAKLRQSYASGATVSFVKADINSALQAIEDNFESDVVMSLNGVVNTASPSIFDDPQKRRLILLSLQAKVDREGV